MFQKIKIKIKIKNQHSPATTMTLPAAFLATGRLVLLHSLNASERISIILFNNANPGASGNAIEKKVTCSSVVVVVCFVLLFWNQIKKKKQKVEKSRNKSIGNKINQICYSYKYLMVTRVVKPSHQIESSKTKQ